MKSRSIKILMIFVLFSFFATGCIGVNRDFRNIKNNILHSVNDRFEKDVEFSVGPGLLFLAGMFVQFAEEENENIDDILDNISRVQVGVYKREGNSFGNYDLSYLEKMDADLRAKGWKYLVKSRNSREISAVYVQSNIKELKSIFVIALQEDELALVEVTGDLDNLIEVVIREEGFHLASN